MSSASRQSWPQRARAAILGVGGFALSMPDSMVTTHAPREDRRRRRSDDPITALHYQLSFTRHEADLDALVLVDDRGCLVAGAGAWPVCEELAAFAPLLANPAAARSETVVGRLGDLRRDVAVCATRLDGVDVLLCGRGGSAGRTALLERAIAGCERILRG
jgi:hypothetical protein